MSFISYAQNFEDVMLWRALKHVKKGFYIDVGANHPQDDSVTKAFYNHGWSGINIEPEKQFFELLQKERKRDTNLEVAVSSQNDDLQLYIFETRGWTTADINVAKEHQAQGYDYRIETIKTKSLDEICQEYPTEEVHFLKIDVEGAEKSVLESFSFKDCRPWIIIVEATQPNTSIDISDKWEYILFKHHYLFAYFDGINKFYLAKEHKNLLDAFRYPPNALDDFISINQHNAEIRANAYQTQIRSALNAVSQAEETASKAQIAANTAQEQYQAIIKSHSWKITKPIRKINNILTRLFKKISSKKTDKQLLVDVSQIYFDDNQTGIQRVIHNIIQELFLLNIQGYVVLPVYATMDKGYHYTAKFNTEKSSRSHLDEKAVTVQKGDIFLGLDLTAHLFPNIETTLQNYKEKGVSVNYVVYDIIPLLYPHFTTKGMDTYFQTWIQGLARYSDRLLCISNSVADDLTKYLNTNNPSSSQQAEIVSFHLGANIEDNTHTHMSTEKTQSALNRLKGELTFLMVGTVEPRKGHQQVLSAFEKLWEKGENINLVIVGKAGWMVEDLLKKIQTHPELNQHLLWFQNLNDHDLSKLYSSSSSLIMASETEGFGLPIIEAARYRLPIITRDIPVFREIAQEHAFYFKNNTQTDTIVKAITEWIEHYKADTHPKSEHLHWYTWEESALSLLKCLGLDMKTVKTATSSYPMIRNIKRASKRPLRYINFSFEKLKYKIYSTPKLKKTVKYLIQKSYFFEKLLQLMTHYKPHKQQKLLISKETLTHLENIKQRVQKHKEAYHESHQ